MESVHIRSFFWSVFFPNTGKYGTEKTPYLDTYHAVKIVPFKTLHSAYHHITTRMLLNLARRRAEVKILKPVTAREDV